MGPGASWHGMPAPRRFPSAPPAGKRQKVPEPPRAGSTPPGFVNPERVFRGLRRERYSQWTPTLGDKPSAGSYDLEDGNA